MNRTLLIAMIVAALLACVYVFSWAFVHLALAFVIAYLLNPAVNKLTALHLPRTLSSIIMIIVLVGMFMVLLLVISPIIYSQSLLMIQKGSYYQQMFKSKIMPQFLEWASNISPDIVSKLEDSAASVLQGSLQFIGNIMSKFFTSGVIAIDIASLLFITPIIGFYILRDWPQVIADIFKIMPVRVRPIMRELAAALDGAMSGYLRGQAYVCLIMGVYYAIALSVLGIDSAIVLGLCSWLIISVPYIGAAMAGLLCCIMAWMQYGSFYYFAFAAGIFIIGQIMESNFIFHFH